MLFWLFWTTGLIFWCLVLPGILVLYLSVSYLFTEDEKPHRNDLDYMNRR